MAHAQSDTSSGSTDGSISSPSSPHATTFDLADRGALCSAIVSAVSAATDVPGHELDEPLNDAIDVDALEQLFRPRLDGTVRSDGRVDFTYCDRRVVLEHVSGETKVFVWPKDQ